MINAKRLNFVLYGVLGLMVIGAFLLTVYTNKWLTNRSHDLVSVKLDTAALEEKQRNNQRAANELETYKATRQTLEKIIPENKDQAKAIGELLTIASEVGVTISNISFPTSELGTGTKATGSASTAVTQAKAVDNIPGLLGIEVTLSQIDRLGSVSGSGMTYSQLLTFLESVEKNRRTMQIKTIEVLPLKAAANSAITGYALTLKMNIFVKP